MADVVVDSSFVVAVMVDAEHTPFARAAVTLFDDAILRAPALICWEVANVLQVKLRRHELPADERLEHLSTFELLGIELDAVPEAESLRDVVRLCGRTGLTAYDGAYLHLALSAGADIATIDKRLTAAALAEGLTVHSPFA